MSDALLLIKAWLFSVLVMKSVPGDEVELSADYIKYEPRRWRTLPANLYNIGL